MRILVDHQAFSLQNTGGITLCFFELLKYFRETPGLSTEAMLGFSDTRWPLQELAGPQSRVRHFGPRVMGSAAATYILNELLLNPLSLASGRYSIYHSTLYRFMPGVRAARYVATHHDCVQERFPHLFPDAARILRTKRRMFRKADLILCVSAASQADLLSFYDVDPSKTRVVHNGLTPPVRTPSGPAALSAHTQRPFLLYVGSRVSYKNFDGLLQAFARSGLSRHYNLLALGGGLLSQGERQLIAQWKLQDAVVHVPYAPPDLMAEAYAQARLMVYPSLYEGFGFPPLEAMTMGTPALVSSNPATREICRDAALFFDLQHPEDFTAKLVQGVEDHALRESLVSRGHALTPTYTWRATAQQTLAAYGDALQR